MRRMMHAAVVLLSFSSFVNAQTSLPLDIGDQSILIRPSESAESIPATTQDAPSLQSQPMVVPPTFLEGGCNRPYSQLGVSMNCNDSCPNLWGNYQAERAALAAQICKHIDGQCGCLNGSHCFHSQASSPCGGCESGCSSKASCFGKRNRYREPFSSLYGTPSSGSTGSCLRKHTGPHGLDCTEPTCTNCTFGDEQSTNPSMHPASAIRLPVPTRLATPPRNRVAEPMSKGIQAIAPAYRGPEVRR